MSHVTRFFTLALICSITLASFTESDNYISNVTTGLDSGTQGLSNTEWVPPGKTAGFHAQPQGIPGLSVGGLLSSLLHPPPTPVAALPPASQQLAATANTAQVGQSGGDGGLGALISVLGAILNPQPSPADAAPSASNPSGGLPAVPIPLDPLVSALSSILSFASPQNPPAPGGNGLLPPAVPSLIPTPGGGLSLQPALPSVTLPLPGITDVTPAITVGASPTPGLAPLLTAASLPISDIPALISEITSQAGSLSAIIASEIASLTNQVFSAASEILTEVPVLSIELPSLTIAVPVPTGLLSDLSNGPLPTDVPLSQLAATLSDIVGPGNAGLVSSIVGAVVSTLDNIVLSSQVSNLISEATVAAGAMLSAVTQE